MMKFCSKHDYSWYGYGLCPKCDKELDDWKTMNKKIAEVKEYEKWEKWEQRKKMGFD